MKRLRLPLYARILLWFFLNLVLLAAVFALLFQAQFSFNLDWFLAGGARERLEAVRNLIVEELSEVPPDEWTAVLQRYSAAHHVEFALFDDDVQPLVGPVTELPAGVRERALGRLPNFPPNTRFTPPPGAPPPEWRGRFRPSIRAVMRTQQPTFYWLITSARIDNWLAGEPMRVILVARSSTMSAGGLIFNPRPWLALGLGAIIFSLLFWLPLIGGITRAVGRMRNATRKIAEGDFSVRVKMRRRDELGSLADSIDQMAARLEGFVQGQKRFLGDIAHELCAPLARLQMALGIMEQRASPEQAASVKSATEKAGQIAALVGELLSFSRASYGAGALQLEAVNVRAAVEEAVERERGGGAEIAIDVPDELSVTAEKTLLVRALANLLRNAIRYAASAGPIRIKAAAHGADIEITVTDAGPGVSAEELPRIFDAFYRVDTSRTRDTGGSGLGLAIVKASIEACGGTVLARNADGAGLQVLIRLRAAESKTPRLEQTKRGVFEELRSLR